MALERAPNATEITIASGQTLSSKIDIRRESYGNFTIPSAMTSTAITFVGTNKPYPTNQVVADVPDADFVPIYNSSNAQVSQTIPTNASRSYPLPFEAMGCSFIRLVAGSAEGATRTIYVSRKG